MEHLNNFFYIQQCPICNQDDLKIMKQMNDNKYYIACDECLSEWQSPEDIHIPNKSTLNTYGPSAPATWEEIKAAGWDKYVENKPTFK